MEFNLSDFSGGITDTPFNSPENCGESLDNFFIMKDKSIETVPGIEVLGVGTSRIATSTRISKLSQLTEDVFIAFSGKRAFAVDESSITEILGPTSNNPFSAGDANSIVSTSLFNSQLICTNDDRSYTSKIFIDDTSTTQLRTAGLPPLASSPTITPSAAGARNYIYAFVHYYEYRVGQTLFVDVSSPIYVTKTLHNEPSGATLTSVASIPVLSNGADYNWLTSGTGRVKIQCFRTVNNGSTFYFVDEVSNGTTTLSDGITDALLILNEPLYVTGGVQPNDMPPASKYLFEANDACYYLDIIQNNEEKPFRFIQAVTNDPDSVPEGNFTDTKSNLKGGSSVGRSPVVFTENETLRIDGVLDELGRGSPIKEVLSPTIGCIAHNSIVKAARGIYFAGTNGFYFTDGFSAPTKLAKIGPYKSKIDELYRQITATSEQRSRIQGCYDKENNRIYWTIQLASTDCDTILVYEETHDSFTTISNNGGILPTALLMDGEDLIIGDANGYLFRMSSDFYTHPKVNTAAAVSTWSELPIIYSWKSTWLNLGDASKNKWIHKINTQGNPSTNVNLAIRSYTNGESLSYKELYPLRIVTGFVWGDTTFIWGDDAFVWNRTSTMNQTRRFPSGRLRARHRQLEYTNAYFRLNGSTSDTDSYVTINGTSNIATLVNPTDYSFGSGNEDYDLIVDGATYTVTSGTSDTLTLADPDGTLINGTYPWEMKGYKKGQRAAIMNFTIEFDPMTDMGTAFKGAASGQ